MFKLITSQTSSATLLEEEEGEHDAVQAAVAAERCCKKALAERLPVAFDSVTSVEQTDTHTQRTMQNEVSWKKGKGWKNEKKKKREETDLYLLH